MSESIRRCRGWFAALQALIVRSLALALLLGAALVNAQGAISFVQVNSATPQAAQTAVSVTYAAAQTAGDLNVVVVGWNDSTAQVSSVTDTRGNVYALAVGPTVQSGTASQAIYYAKNIAAAAANGNIVTVTFTVAASYPDIRIAEYKGLDPVNALDVSLGAQGTSATSSSGAVTTTNANDLLIGANLIQTGTTGPGASFTSRVITPQDADILEDRTVTATGSYSATAPISPSAQWIMQIVAFRAASAGPSITSLSQSSGAIGAAITITGTNFGASQGASTVTFGGTTATTFSSWSATSIGVTVPAGAITGNVVVTVSGTASNGVAFKIVPNISSLSSSSGAIGTPLTITGTGFGASQGTSTVMFNGTSAGTVSAWNATSITVNIPTGATTGNVVVTVSGTASNGVAFTVAPNITSLSQSSGPVGTAITITGTNFGSSQTGNSVTFGGTAATTFSSWSATSIGVTVPAGANPGNVVVTVGGLPSNGVNFTVILPPNITSLSQSSGAIGTAITITGTNFGSSQTGNSVTFGGTAATTFSSWSATSIGVTVPAGANTGNVVVTVSGTASNGVAFTVAPNITSLSQSSGPVGTAITITGTNFGSSQTGNSVTFGGTAATTFSSWSATSIGVTVPAGANPGNVVVTVGGLPSNGVNFTVILPPNITSLSQSSGAIGTAITITGTNFGSSQTGNSVTFGGTAATTFSSWSATSIGVTVPAGANTGNVVVTVSGTASNGVAFTVAPNITSLSQSSGPVGTAITITGTNFGSSQTGNSVTFGGTAATTFSSWSATSIGVTVPAGANPGNVVVTVGGLPSNGVNFTVILPPNITSLSQSSGAIGTAITITGTNFGSSQTGNSVTFGGTAATTFSSWSATSIGVTVPAGANTGNVVVTVSGVPSNGISFIVTGGIKLIQHVSKDAGTTTSSSLAFASNNAAGDWIAVAVRAGKSGEAITVTDSNGNTYHQAVQFSLTVDADTLGIFYAENIKGGANTVSVSDTISGTIRFAILEYSGVATANSLDTTAVAQGTGTSPSSGNATTTSSGDLLIGAILSADPANFTAGSGYTIEESVPSEPNTKLIAEDQVQVNPGTTSASASLGASDPWGAALAAFKPAIGGAPMPTAPSNLTATPISSSQINLAWGASTEAGGSINSYLIERCSGAACSSFAQVAVVTVPTTSYNDTGLTASTSYSYRVRAKDALGNTGPYSNTATTSTLAAVAPTAPTNLTATTLSNTQINLSWTASTESGGTISSYQIARCQGTACSNFVQVGTSATASFNDTGLLGSTTYTYEVRAVDNLNNVGPYSTTASATTLAPTLTAPSNLTATAVSNTQINLSWTASTETGGTITNYLIERCQGSGCSSFAQVASVSAPATTYNDTALIGTTTYNYRVRATDAGNNVSSYSNTATATTLAGVSAISFVQVNSAIPHPSATSVAIPFTKAQTAGDLNVVVLGWNDSITQVSSVVDSKGNAYLLAVGPEIQTGIASQAIYYAANISAAAANSNTVTVTFNGAANAPDIRIAEYSGIDPVIPLDVVATAQGNSLTSDSGPATTTNANDLLVGGNLVASGTTGPGTGFTSRVITSPDGDILEDRVVTSTGTYDAIAPVSPTGAWIMQMAAFRAAGSPQPPAITVKVAPSTASTPTGYGTQTFTATLQNDRLNKGVTWSISGAGCSASTCGTLSNIKPTSVSYTAPPNVPNPANVTITATSVQDNSKSGSAAITVTQGTLFVSLTPKRAAVTLSQPQQFTATVFNDPLNGGVTWSVDGSNGGSAASGTIAPSGLYTPGTQPGSHTITATSNSNASINASVPIAVTDLTGVFMYHNDLAGTGQNTKEYALTPTSVNSSTFGMLFSCPVDGYLYADPLYVANVNIGGQTHNVVIIATEHDSVYAFDADSSGCVQLWQKSFLSTGVTTVPAADTNELLDLVPEIGITSTPVIDPSTNTIYVVPKTKETVGSGCSNGSPCYPQRLHALDLFTGNEKFGGPVTITAPNFISLYHLQRAGLAFNSSTVYVAMGSHGDNNTYQGWVFAFNATTLAQKWVYNTTVPTGGNNRGSIWQAGGGISIDASGNLYVETANGVFDGVTNFSDSVIKLSPSGTRSDYFTPFDQGIMQQNDIDLGSAGTIILPDAVGSVTNPHLALATGKIGILYLLDQTNLGQYHMAGNQDVSETTIQLNTTNYDGVIYGPPAYWNGNIYLAIVGGNLNRYTIASGNLATIPSSTSSNVFPFRGVTPVVSANGTSNGIVWVLDDQANQWGGPVVLYAYDATNVTTPLYSSPTIGQGAAGASVKFNIPLVANGKVYVPAQYSFTVYGLLPN